MSELAKKRATYADVLAVPDRMVAEIVDGELYVHPRPAAPHARVESVLNRKVGGPFDDGIGGPGGWVVLIEPELHLGDDVLVPDLAAWRRERLPTMPDTPYFEIVPDWVCEVLSPSTTRVDRIQKMRIYARAGVRFAWLVDPAAKTLEPYRLEGERWLALGTVGGDEVVRVEPFDAVEMDLTPLWTW